MAESRLVSGGKSRIELALKNVKRPLATTPDCGMPICVSRAACVLPAEAQQFVKMCVRNLPAFSQHRQMLRLGTTRKGLLQRRDVARAERDVTGRRIVESMLDARRLW